MEIKESVVQSLDGRDSTLYPLLPYLLQDLWEIGSSPDEIIGLIKRNSLSDQINTVLDLGCGKGAVSIRLSREFGWQAHGIDAMPEFIEDAISKSREYDVEDLCRFEVGDIREKMTNLQTYDLIVLGSIGPVFGDIGVTLKTIKPRIASDGYCILDDGYALTPELAEKHGYPTKEKAHQTIQKTGYTILEEYIIPQNEIAESDNEIFQQIEFRVQELIQKHPDKKELLEGYLRAQREEGAILENDLACVTWLLKIAH